MEDNVKRQIDIIGKLIEAFLLKIGVPKEENRREYLIIK